MMQAIIVAPPDASHGPDRQSHRSVEGGGPTVEVQTDLDGVWHTGQGAGRRLVRLDPAQAAGDEGGTVQGACASWPHCTATGSTSPRRRPRLLRESLADVPFFTMPLEKLIADQWPAKKSGRSLAAELGIRRPAATDLVKLLEQLGQFDAAIDIQSRVVLASYWPGGLPYQDIEKLWALLKKRPVGSPLPRVAWINLLSPDRPSIEFDLDSFSAPKAGVQVEPTQHRSSAGLRV